MELEVEPNEKRTPGNPEVDAVIYRIIEARDQAVDYCQQQLSLRTVVGSARESARAAGYFVLLAAFTSESNKPVDIITGAFVIATAPLYIPVITLAGAVSPLLTQMSKDRR